MDESDDDGPQRRPKRNPMVAAVLSTVIWPGLGQMYCGRTGRGFACMAAVVALAVLIGVTVGGNFVGLAVVAAMVAGGVDAWRAASDG